MKNIHVCPVAGSIGKTFYFIVHIHSFSWCALCRNISLYGTQTILFILTCLLIFKAMLEGVYVKELIFPWRLLDLHWFPFKTSFVTFAWNIKLATCSVFSCSRLAPGNKEFAKVVWIFLTSPFYVLFLFCRYFKSF